jgi:hypothetical protein
MSDNLTPSDNSAPNPPVGPAPVVTPEPTPEPVIVSVSVSNIPTPPDVGVTMQPDMPASPT